MWPGVKHCGKDNTTLFLNQACLHIVSNLPNALEIKYQFSECYNCSLLTLGTIAPNSSSAYVIETSFPIKLKAENVDVNCTDTQWLDNFGLYAWTLQSNACSRVSVEQNPERFWSNAIALCSIWILVLLSYWLFKCVKKRNWFFRAAQPDVATFQPFPQEDDESVNGGVAEVRTRRPTRVASIDVFRGLTITVMVFVNYGGGQYSLFKHVPWNGLHIADVVFPFFIWIMGVSTVISLRSHLRASINKKTIFLKICRRALLLLALGIFLNSGKTSASLRIPGVLQRIAVTYFIVACIELFASKPQRSDQYGPWNVCAEFVDYWLQWHIAALFVTAHLALTFLLPVPGCPTGYLGPGGLSAPPPYENCTGGAAAYIDRLVFGPEHMYRRPTCAQVYQSTVPYDPEGLLGVLMSVFAAFLGGHCGRIMLCHEHSNKRMARWLLSTIILGLVAGVLCNWQKEGGLLPVNKNLWSLSYVLATTSMAFGLFTLLYWVVDVLRLWQGRPFNYAGMNSILIYLGHEILKNQLPWRWRPWTTTHFEVLLMDSFATVCWLFVAWVLHRRDVFLKL